MNTLKKEVETLNKKLAELSEDELEQVTGGWGEEKFNGPKNWEDSNGTTFRCPHKN